MRIIAGSFKGRKLESPEGRDTRPTADKVKEAMFSILMNDIEGKKYCDLFAGSGSLGIEALSRGAEFCYFSETSKQAFSCLLRNIKLCGAQEYSKVFAAGYEMAIERLVKEEEKIDVFLLDPPYGRNLVEIAVKKIAESDILAKEGLVVIEHDKADNTPDCIGRLKKIKQRKYGRVVISIFMC